MSESTEVVGTTLPTTPVPPPSVTWLLRVAVVYAVVEVAVVVTVGASDSGDVGAVVGSAAAPLVRTALALATWRGHHGARIGTVVVDVLGVIFGVLLLVATVRDGEPFLAIVAAFEVVLIAAMLVLALRGSTADWCHRSAARRRGDDPDAPPPDVPAGPGTATVTLRLGGGPVRGRPLVLVPEEQSTTTETGAGTRGCGVCGTRWRSFVADLTDSGRLAEQPDAEVEAVVTWAEVVGLTCRSCGGGVCRDHGIRVGVGTGKGSELRCPTCTGRLLLG